MRYQIVENGIKIFDKTQFNPQHILECGQVFCFDKIGEDYIVFPQDKFAQIIEKNDHFLIKTMQKEYFIHFFDLETDYQTIKNSLMKFDIMHKSIAFGGGIRILNQDLFEVLISFIISANNNIKRINVILNNIRKALGKEIAPGVFSFPSYELLKAQNEEFFIAMGAGYRAKYLVKVMQQVTPQTLQKWRVLDGATLRKNLISLAGVGPKVADCVMLFGYHNGDSFPVDTWIEQMYNSAFGEEHNREMIRRKLVEMFGALSGYAQQYLFYFTREMKNKE